MIAAAKPFLIPIFAALIGLALLVAWAYDYYDGWGKPILAAAMIIGGAYGVSEASNAEEEDRG